MRTRRSYRNQDRLFKAIGKELSNAAIRESLFCGLFPTGWSWCDTAIEENGDYKQIAYMSYRKLELEVYVPSSPLLPLIRKDAAELQAKRGQEYAIAGNMVITLGGTR